MEREKIRYWLEQCRTYGAISNDLPFVLRERGESTGLVYSLWAKTSSLILCRFLKDAGISWLFDGELPSFSPETAAGFLNDLDGDPDYWWHAYCLSDYEYGESSPLQEASEVILGDLIRRFPSLVIRYQEPLTEDFNAIMERMPDDGGITVAEARKAAVDFRKTALSALYEESVSHYGLGFDEFVNRHTENAEDDAVITEDTLMDWIEETQASTEARVWIGFGQTFLKVPSGILPLLAEVKAFAGSFICDYSLGAGEYLRIPDADAFTEYTDMYAQANISSPFLWIYLWLLYEEDFAEVFKEVAIPADRVRPEPQAA